MQVDVLQGVPLSLSIFKQVDMEEIRNVSTKVICLRVPAELSIELGQP